MMFYVLEPSRTYVKKLYISSGWFKHIVGVFQAHRTSSNLLRMNDIRESEVCRVLSHKFVVVQSHKTLHN